MLNRTKDGDRIVFVATKTEGSRPEIQGKVLGMAEIGRAEISTLDLIPDHSKIEKGHFDSVGNHRWPNAIPMTKAWRFINPPLLTDILEKQLPRSATSNAVLLNDKDKNRILSLPHEEVELLITEKLNQYLENRKNLNDFKSIPNEWKLEIARMTKSVQNTIKNDGRESIVTNKYKNGSLNEAELQLLIAKKLKKQNYLCAITQRKLIPRLRTHKLR